MLLNLRELAITLTEDNAIAAAAMGGHHHHEAAGGDRRIGWAIFVNVF
jgi:hypothetical protein